MDDQLEKLLAERFGKDTLIALATVDQSGVPCVRAVNALYDDGAFYCITYLQSNKMKQIEKCGCVGICAEWFTGHGRAENLGWVCDDENREIAQKLRSAFSAWYQNGHIDETDKNTIILKISLTDGVLMAAGKKYEF